MNELALSPAGGKENIGIDLMKALFAICVVAIHTHPYPNFVSAPFSLTRALDILLLCAVPFFFITTGYFIGNKLRSPFSDEKNMPVLRYYLIKYVKLYLIWTAVYLPITLYHYIALSDQGLLSIAVDFLRGLVFRGEQWNSWMLWYLLSMIYALILLSIIRRLGGSYGIVYLISALIFALSAVFDYYSNMPEAGLLIKGLRFFFGENGRLFTAPFYLSIGMIIRQSEKMTFKSSLAAGLTLISAGFLIKSGNEMIRGGGTLILV